MPEKYSKPKFDDEATARVEAEVRRALSRQPKPPERRRWRDFYELACWMAERAHSGRTVVLSPTTAAVVAAQLARLHEKPTRDEVALMICRRGEAKRCNEPCYECRGRANIVVGAYGWRPDERPE